jgi:hypothetical protein
MITLKEIVNVVGKPHLENLKIQVRQDITALQHCSYTFVRIQKQSKQEDILNQLVFSYNPAIPQAHQVYFLVLIIAFFP